MRVEVLESIVTCVLPHSQSISANSTMAFSISQIYMYDGSIAVSELSVCWIYDGSIGFIMAVSDL